MNKRYKFSTIDDVNRLYNIPTLHPLISVIKLSDVKPIDIHHSEMGIYTIATLKTMAVALFTSLRQPITSRWTRASFIG